MASTETSLESTKNQKSLAFSAQVLPSKSPSSNQGFHQLNTCRPLKKMAGYTLPPKNAVEMKVKCFFFFVCVCGRFNIKKKSMPQESKNSCPKGPLHDFSLCVLEPKGRKCPWAQAVTYQCQFSSATWYLHPSRNFCHCGCWKGQQGFSRLVKRDFKSKAMQPLSPRTKMSKKRIFPHHVC